jgi:hypothetical protein
MAELLQTSIRVSPDFVHAGHYIMLNDNDCTTTSKICEAAILLVVEDGIQKMRHLTVCYYSVVEEIMLFLNLWCVTLTTKSQLSPIYSHFPQNLCNAFPCTSLFLTRSLSIWFPTTILSAVLQPFVQIHFIAKGSCM